MRVMVWLQNKVKTAPERLALPLEIDTGRWDTIFRHILVVLSGFVFVLILIAAFAPVREVALAQGKIIPVGDVVELQHAEGGMIAEIAVREGQLVDANSVIMRVDPIGAGADFAQTNERLQGRRLDEIRLRALIEDMQPDFSLFQKSRPKQVRDQWSLFEAEHKSFLASESGGRLRVAQKIAERESAKAEISSTTAQVAIDREQFSMRKELLSQGFTSRKKYLEAKSVYERSKGGFAKAKAALEVSKKAVDEAKSALAQLRADKRREWNDTLSKVEGEIAELKQSIKKLKDRVDRLEIRAPVAGIVQSLAATSTGEVLAPGALVAEIVPSDRSIEAEVKVPPEHIGHIQVGSEAEVKLTAFDQETYGFVIGTVANISPTTFPDEEGGFYYKASLALDRQSLSFAGIEKKIQPGMVAEAKIITGAKSLLRYLLKPVYRSLGRAFSER